MGWRRKGWVFRNTGGLVLSNGYIELLSQCRACQEKVRGAWILCRCLQDVDAVFLSKMELEGKLESLREYFCFLKRLYEEVRLCQG
jgi:hypothetical protein